MKTQNFSSFAQLVNNTSRKERNQMFGSSLVYSAEYDIETVAENVNNLITLTKGYLESLEYVQGLINDEKANYRQKKALLLKLSELTVEELKSKIS